MDEIWTILKILNWTQDYFTKKQIPNARLDAEILLGHCLNLKRMDLYMQFDRPLKPDELSCYKALIKRRLTLEPIAYITGIKEFWSRPFIVGPEVLIPRPETEMIIEKILETKKKDSWILDIGTGSGILAITLALECPEAHVTAIDKSETALHFANLNAQKLCPEKNIDFKQTALENFYINNTKKFDLIVSNPPYIASEKISTLMDDVQKFEPSMALDGGTSGLDFYFQITRFAEKFLNPDGVLFVEIGEDQGISVSAIFKDSGFADVKVFKDYAGLDRVVKASAKI